MKDQFKIAIIDSGYDFSRPLSCHLVEYKNFCEGIWKDENGHGTSITLIIDNICKDCELYLFKVLDSKKTGSFRSVETAINYALDKNVDMINASFGIELDLYDKEIHTICNRAFHKGVILATTCSNNQSRNYLYENDKVLKVIGGKGICENRLFYKDDVFFVMGMARMIPWLGGHYLLRGGNSFSVPYIFPYILEAKKAGCIVLDDILDFLRNSAEKVSDTRIFYDYPMITKEKIANKHTYKIVKDFISELGFLEKDHSISNHVFEPYKAEDILHGLGSLLQCQLPCMEFQYPDWCYIENLSNKIYKIMSKMKIL